MMKDKSIDKGQFQMTDKSKVPFKLAPTDPAKSKTQGQYAVQVKKVPFKGYSNERHDHQVVARPPKEKMARNRCCNRLGSRSIYLINVIKIIRRIFSGHCRKSYR